MEFKLIVSYSFLTCWTYLILILMLVLIPTPIFILILMNENKFITNLTVLNLNLQFATQIGTDTEKSATNYSHQSKIGTRPKLPVTIMAPVW